MRVVKQYVVEKKSVKTQYFDPLEKHEITILVFLIFVTKYSK